jgi:hypothetical protein
VFSFAPNVSADQRIKRHFGARYRIRTGL